MSSPDIGPLETEAVLAVLASRRLSQGPFLEEFEGRLAEFLGCAHCVGVSSGTAALHLALRAAGVGPGDQVLTTPFSFVASANAALYLGAKPVFSDVEEATGNLDPERLEHTIRSMAQGPSAKLKAIVPVHVFGQPAAMEAIESIAQKYRLEIVEDACEALGSELSGRKAGTFGAAAAFGFYPNKQLTTGEGGIIATNRQDWAEKFRSWRNQGRGRGGADETHGDLGYNYRLDEMSAALGAAQAARIEELLSRRERVARWYTERLEGTVGLELPSPSAGATRMSWFVYVVRIQPPFNREVVRAELLERGVPSRVYFPPIHLLPDYRKRWGYRQGDFPVAEQLGATCLALPFSGVMTASQVDRACTALSSALGRQ